MNVTLQIDEIVLDGSGLTPWQVVGLQRSLEMHLRQMAVERCDWGMTRGVDRILVPAQSFDHQGRDAWAVGRAMSEAVLGSVASQGESRAASLETGEVNGAVPPSLHGAR